VFFFKKCYILVREKSSGNLSGLCLIMVMHEILLVGGFLLVELSFVEFHMKLRCVDISKVKRNAI